eukprot:673674-Amphidinium_carterae.1
MSTQILHISRKSSADPSPVQKTDLQTHLVTISYSLSAPLTSIAKFSASPNSSAFFSEARSECPTPSRLTGPPENGPIRTPYPSQRNVEQW